MDPMKAVDPNLVTEEGGISTLEFTRRLITQARRHVAYLNGWMDSLSTDVESTRANRELSYVEPLLLIIADKVEELNTGG